jgi:peptidoglycan/LPS O-acetylase OafA/YrhL
MGVPACMVCAGAIFVRDDGTLGPIRRLGVLAGDASFALYLSHPFTLAIVAALWKRSGIGHPTAYVVAGFIASMAVAVGLYLWIEKPGMARLNRWVRAVSSGPRRGLVLHPLKEPHAQ